MMIQNVYDCITHKQVLSAFNPIYQNVAIQYRILGAKCINARMAVNVKLQYLRIWEETDMDISAERYIDWKKKHSSKNPNAKQIIDDNEHYAQIALEKILRDPQIAFTFSMAMIQCNNWDRSIAFDSPVFPMRTIYEDNHIGKSSGHKVIDLTNFQICVKDRDIYFNLKYLLAC